MSDVYTPPEVWTWDQNNGGKFASTNRPIAGATHTKELPVGQHDFQLHSMATPNGVKVTIMFEELLELGIQEVTGNSSTVCDVLARAPHLPVHTGHVVTASMRHHCLR